MELGERLRVARTGAKLTQLQVAKHFNISRPTVTQWEAGTHRPDQDKFSDLAIFLGVPLDWLMSGDGPPPSRNTAVVPTSAKLLRTSKRKFYVREWREFMGDKVEAAAEAAGLPPDEYQAFETYPVNFTLGQLEAVAEEIGIQGHQFWFPPPKAATGPTSPHHASIRHPRKIVTGKLPSNVRITKKA